MSKYVVRTHELQWYNCSYTVEADSEEEAFGLVESGLGDFLNYSDYDTTEQIDLETVEALE